MSLYPLLDFVVVGQIIPYGFRVIYFLRKRVFLREIIGS